MSVGSVVDVSDWKPDEENPIHPIGSQPKSVLICPTNVSNAELIPGHRYLFKVPPAWKAYQVWSELIASQLGNEMGVNVPRCFIGHNERGEVGALVEFFFGYPTESPRKRFVHASDLLRKTIIDEKRGKPHSLRINLNFGRVFGIKDASIWWARTLLLDALIGNTDRHPVVGQFEMA